MFSFFFFSLRHATHSNIHRITHQSVTPPSRPVRKISTVSPPPSAPPFLSTNGQSAFSFAFSSPVPEDTMLPSSPPGQAVRSSTSPVKMVTQSQAARRSSDSDISTNTPPKGNIFSQIEYETLRVIFWMYRIL